MSVTWTEQPRTGFARRYRIACECHPDFVGSMESDGYDITPGDDARRIADLTAEANRFHAAFVAQRAEKAAEVPTTARVGDVLTRENARVGMRFNHGVGSCEHEVTGDALCYDRYCDVRGVPIAFDCHRRPIITALPEAQPAPVNVVLNMQAAGDSVGDATLRNIARHIRDAVARTGATPAPAADMARQFVPESEPAHSAAPVAWDGIPSREEPTPRLCEHGYPLVGDCQRCEHDRRFYARGMNETSRTDSDAKGRQRWTTLHGWAELAEGGYETYTSRLRRGEWVTESRTVTPQTRESRLEAAGFRVVDE